VISYSLACSNGHGFDAWFRNAEAFEAQREQGAVTCPTCNSAQVDKALMAPALNRSSGKMAMASGHPEHARILAAMRALKQKLVSEADYVGDKFAEEARKIHYEEADPRGIYGEATSEEAEALAEEGIAFMPLPNLPEEHN
jgi:hypothetical protein